MSLAEALLKLAASVPTTSRTTNRAAIYPQPGTTHSKPKVDVPDAAATMKAPTAPKMVAAPQPPQKQQNNQLGTAIPAIAKV